MRWIRAAAAAVVTTTLLAGPVAAPAAASEGALRYTSVGGSARWGWHKVAHLPDGTRTFRTGFFVAAWADVRDGGQSRSEERIYAHTEDYTFRGDGSYAGRVNRLYAATRDTLTWTIAPDYSSARVTGTMVETVCDTSYEVCAETGAVGVDVRFAAANLEVYDNDTHHPTRWQGQLTHIYAGATTAYTPAYGDIGAQSFPVTYAATYSVFDALTKSSCRNKCEFWVPVE